MDKISMIMFDISGTTIEDDLSVRDCLYKAAKEFKLNTSKEEIHLYQGMNKIHLYQFLIARSRGRVIDIKDFEKKKDPETSEEAKKIFNRYTELMIDHYKKNGVKEIPGTSDTFRWCKKNGIKVCTDTGFHHDVMSTILEEVGWLKDELIDLAVDVEDIPGNIGRPAPFMIYYAMNKLNVQNIHEVVKVGDTAADMLEGYNAGCGAIIAVLSGSRPLTSYAKYRHSHVIESVADIPELIESGLL